MLQTYFQKAKERCWEIYERYYPHDGYKRHNDRYRETIAQYLTPDTCLFDAGCGSDMIFTREFCPKVRLAVGLDIGQFNAVTSVPHAICGDLNHVPFKNDTFDIIISKSVLEHLSDPESVFREFSRILRKNGFIILLTPNKYDYGSIIAMATPFSLHQWILSRLLGEKEEDVFPTFFRANTQKEIIRLFKHLNFKTVNVVLFNQYPFYLMFSPSLFYLGIFYERLTSRYKLFSNLRGWILAVAQKV